MKNKTFVLRLSVLASAIVLLAGCGGGGGGGDTTAPPPAAGGAIDGVAAMGFLQNAKVTAYCGNSEAAADLLVTGVTTTAGGYSLNWTSACIKPVKLVVEEVTGTTIADQATGENVTPADGFKLRALVADPSITTTKHITPFTDMAAEIAGTSATLSKTAASNAEAAITITVLGSDIGAYQATPRAPTVAAMATASVNEKKLATLLTVVSAFAQDDATCSLKLTDGDKIKCATNTFAAQAKATVTGVSDTGYTVATTVPAKTPASMLTATLFKIRNGTITGVRATGPQALSPDITNDTSGTAALLTSATNAVATAALLPGGNVVVTAASGIQAARDLFNSLKTDLAALSNGKGDGFLDQKLSDMNADFTTNANSSALGFTDNLQALKRATKMARDAKTATWTVPGTLLANTVYRVPNSDVALQTDGAGARLRFLRSHSDGMNCYVQFSDLTLGKAGCYYSNGQPNVPLTPTTFTGFYHAVEVVESTTASGTYTWQDFMASRTYSSLIQYANPTFYLINGNGRFVGATPQVETSTRQTGTAVVTLNSAGDITAATIKGNIQPLVTGQDFSTLDISGVTSTISSTSETVTLAGTVTNVKGAVTTLTMALSSGSQLVHAIATPTTSDHPISVNLITQIKTTAFQFDGTLVVDTFTADQSGNFQPGNASFTGKISTVANGTATEFLNGTLGFKQINLADFNPGAVTSATNFLKRTATFSGKVTNGATTYALTFSFDGSTFDQESVTLNYTRNGTQMISFTSTKSATTNSIEIRGSGDVNAVLTDGIGAVKIGTTTVGSITKNPSRVDFNDGTFLLLGA